MTLWRSPGVLRVKVLGLVWRGSQFLAAELPDDNGKILGVRPLGGTIEFGETREQALAREFREELGCGIDIAGPWIAIENIFEHQGVPGHRVRHRHPTRRTELLRHGCNRSCRARPVEMHSPLVRATRPTRRRGALPEWPRSIADGEGSVTRRTFHAGDSPENPTFLEFSGCGRRRRGRNANRRGSPAARVGGAVRVGGN